MPDPTRRGPALSTSTLTRKTLLKMELKELLSRLLTLPNLYACSLFVFNRSLYFTGKVKWPNKWFTVWFDSIAFKHEIIHAHPSLCWPKPRPVTLPRCEKRAKPKESPFAGFPPLRGEEILRIHLTAVCIRGIAADATFLPLRGEEIWQMQLYRRYKQR